MQIEELQAFYRQKAEEDGLILEKLKKKIYQTGTIRLIVVLLAISSLYIFRQEGLPVIVLISCIFLTLLLLLVKRHNRLFRKRDYYQVSVRISKEELLAVNYDFTAFDGANEKNNSEHPFSTDIDLFGEKSLFQSLNRTVTPYGKEILAGWFRHPLQTSESITDRQEAVKELQVQTELRKYFRITGLLSPGTMNDMEELRRFAGEKSYILPGKKIWKPIYILYPCFWIIFILLISFQICPISFLAVPIICLYALSESQVKKINRIQNSLEKKVRILSACAELIRSVEECKVQSKELVKLKNQLSNQGVNISVLVKELSGYLNNLDQRSSGLGRFILNTLLLWDIRFALKIENWKEINGRQLDQWMMTLGEFDALCSLGTFAFNHNDYTYPVPVGTYFCLQAERLGHPLMHRNTCVKNDIHIEKYPYFMIITGANMAGKSTYLRTVGINFLLACVGAPVCAQKFHFYPAQLVTSLRTSDSLNDNESYFFAELKRLKMIIDRLLNEEKLFIILDEILKGTNSTDKQKGSLALMKQLVCMDAVGIIATHDLVLGKLAGDFPENIGNFRFEAEIKNELLTFSYSLQQGIAENMNACFLMKKMGITVD